MWLQTSSRSSLSGKENSVLEDDPGRVAGLLYALLGLSVFRPIYGAGALQSRSSVTCRGRVHKIG
jgi:hypothetical protein